MNRIRVKWLRRKRGGSSGREAEAVVADPRFAQISAGHRLKVVWRRTARPPDRPVLRSGRSRTPALPGSLLLQPLGDKNFTTGFRHSLW